MEVAMTKVSPDCPPPTTTTTMEDTQYSRFLLYTSGSTGKPKGVSSIKNMTLLIFKF